jgi:hypothetical protein
MRQSVGQVDVLRLTRLVAPTEQNDQFLSSDDVINPITRPHIDLHFRNAVFQSPSPTRVTLAQSLDPRQNPGSTGQIIETIEPPSKS